MSNTTLEYIQFSKKVTRWGMILVSCAFILCALLIALGRFQAYIVSAINSLYTAYITIMGVTIGAYQGNSSLEKWSKAKYDFELATKTNLNNNEDSSVIEDIESTYG